MTATGHAVIGTLIAAKIPDPTIAIPLAVLSHIAADYFPHWDIGIGRDTKTQRQFFARGFYDVSIGFILSYLLIQFLFPQTNLVYAFVMIISAQFFDWITSPYLFFNCNFPPFIWFYKFQKKFDRPLDMPWGVIGQVAVLIGLIFLALNF